MINFDPSSIPPAQLQQAVTDTNIWALQHMTPERRATAFVALPMDEQVRIFQRANGELKNDLLQHIPTETRIALISALAARGENITTPTNTTAPAVLSPEDSAVQVIDRGVVRSFVRGDAIVDVNATTHAVTVSLNTDNNDPTDDVVMTVQSNGRTQIVANGQNVILQTHANAQRVTTIGQALLRLDPQNIDLTALTEIAMRNANMVTPSLPRDVYTQV